MEARPEEKRDDGERQAQGEVYLDGIEMSIRVRRLGDCTVRLEDGGAHERLKRVEILSQLISRPMPCRTMEPTTVELCKIGLSTEKYDLQI